MLKRVIKLFSRRARKANPKRKRKGARIAFNDLDDNPDDKGFDFDEEPLFFGSALDLGYAPLQLGQRFTGTDMGRAGGSYSWVDTEEYEIVRKLGWGTEASVWLGRRVIKDKIPDPLYCAMKFINAFFTSEVVQKRNHELAALIQLTNWISTPVHPGKQYCTLLQDMFTYRGVAGSHICLVMSAYSLSLQDYVLEMRQHPEAVGFSLKGIKNIVRQVLLALAYVHSRGFIHTDIKMSNIFIDTGTNNEAITDLLHSDPSRTYPPRHEPTISSKPIITVVSQPLPLFGGPDHNQFSLKLGDFGSAVPLPTRESLGRTEMAMPTLLRAPEIILECPWSKEVDIWAVGCLILDLVLKHRTVFDLDIPPGSAMTSTDVHVARIEELLGPFSPSFLERCNAREKYFDVSGQPLRKVVPGAPGGIQESGNLTQQLSPVGQDGMSDTELHELERFMRGCLTVDPASRPSAEELLKDPWLEESDTHVLTVS